MAIYTVHQPPRSEHSAPDPERFVFVRDGFTFWAFLLPPLWMLWHRLWLAFVGYIVVTTGLQFGLRSIDASPTLSTVAVILLSLLIGLEAASLRRRKLARRGWTTVGLVVGDDLELAERRFFDAWFKDDAVEPGAIVGPRPSVPPAPIPPRPQAGTTDQIVGLFPEPGASR
jgi:Protein of unknown function (DUF2628)